jgi:hypothetical protein
MLYANGNPMCLINGYRDIVLEKISTLLMLDDIKKLSEREARKKRKELESAGGSQAASMARIEDIDT